MSEEAFLIGGGQVHRLLGPHGETPACPEAKFNRGDVVKIRNRKALRNFPPELVVLVAVPPGFPADYALADLLNKRRPLMITKPSRTIKYVLCREGDTTPYLIGERDLLTSGKEPVQIGTITSMAGGSDDRC